MEDGFIQDYERYVSYMERLYDEEREQTLMEQQQQSGQEPKQVILVGGE